MDWLRQKLTSLAYRELWRESKTLFSRTVMRSGPVAYRKRTWFALVTESPFSIAFLFIAVILAAIAIALNWPQLAPRFGNIVLFAVVWINLSGARKTRNGNQVKFIRTTVKAAEVAATERTEAILASLYEVRMTNAPYNKRYRGPSSEHLVEKAIEGLENDEKPFVRLEFVFVVIGTVLSCVGDWLTCSLHAWSWSTCSS